jgi:hypothetical protein
MRVAIQAVLALVIVALGYFLYISITEPYEAIRIDEELTDLTRERMDRVRFTAIQYERQYDRFPSTLDSLRMFALTDSAIVATADSVYGMPTDSIFVSPRTGAEFVYAINDTSTVAIYELRDPESDDVIGALTPDVTKLNAASWE